MEPDALTRQPQPVAALRSVTKVLARRVTALQQIDLTVHAGQAMGLAGPNGAGKSTLLRILLGLVRPTAGHAELFGQPVRPGMAALARVGALVDGPGFVPYLTGRKNLRLTVRTSGKTVSPEQLEQALNGSGLGDALDRPYRTYSHGMRYRLGFAQALIGQPDLLLLDEPTTGLDPTHALEVVDQIRSAVAAGTTMIVSSHELALLEQVCSHVTVLHRGRVALSAPTQELIGSAGSLANAYVQTVGGAVSAAASAQPDPSEPSRQ